jgi:asparagine synthase (glutamine-hydrolysing)
MARVMSKPSPRTAKMFTVDVVRELIDQPLNEVSIGHQRRNIDHALAMSGWLERHSVELV